MAADRPRPDWPLVVAYGLGVNSTAMLVEFPRRAIRPDLILFADSGGEKPETYQYPPVVQRVRPADHVAVIMATRLLVAAPTGAAAWPS